MSERKPTEATAAGEPFLQRWSKKKAQARTGVDEEADEPVEAGSPAPLAASEAEPIPPEPVVLPDLDSLDGDSDYSSFLTPGVDENLRRTALRKLFHSPKFNICDGMDDYCEDFTKFEALGDLVTADMRHHLERAARAVAEALERQVPGEEVTAVAATPASEPPPADTSTRDSKAEHDEPDRPA